MIRLLLTFALLSLSFNDFAQNVLTQINSAERVKAINGMMIGSNLFLNVSYASNENDGAAGLLIRPDGTSVQVNTRILKDKLLIAGVLSGDSTSFYYIDVVKKVAFLRAWVISNQSGTGSASSCRIEIPGQIYGSFVEGDALYLLCAMKNSYTLQLIRVVGSSVNSTKNYKLSIDLGKMKSNAVAFFEIDNQNFRGSTASMRVVKDRRTIWIVADEPAEQFEDTTKPSTIFKTTVVRLDRSNEGSEVRTFYEQSRNKFASAISGEDVVRVIFARKNIRIQHFYFHSGKLINTSLVSLPLQHTRDSVYARSGSKGLVFKGFNSKGFASFVPGCFLITDSLDASRQILTFGTYINTSNVPVIAPIGGLAVATSLAITALSLIARDISEGDTDYTYIYAIGNGTSGYHMVNHSNALRQHIDDYELNLQGSAGFSYKGYIHAGNTIYGILQRTKRSPIEIVRFQQ
ncbi:MAG: hypothetical protein WKF87_01870 [Chryseolinea sp.]